jgi:hypothetical protein
VKPFSLIVIFLAAVGLAGCFTSDQSFLTDDNSVAPYATITFRDKGSNDASRLTRHGKAYVAEGSDNGVTMRFMPLDRPDLYVAEVSGNASGVQRRLYAVVKVDFATGTAQTYKAIAGDDDAGPGLRACEDHMICIDDLKAYIASAEAAIDAGAEPDATYVFTVVKGEPAPELKPTVPASPSGGN